MNGLVDIRTASLLSGVTGTIVCLYMVYVRRTRKTYPGFQQWTIASLCLSSSMGLIYLRDLAPDWASIVLSNFLVVFSAALIARGLAAFVGRQISLWWLIVPVAISLGTSIVFTYGSVDARSRIVVGSLVNGAVLVHCIVLARRWAAPQGLPVGWLAMSLGLLASWYFIRTVLTVLFEGSVQDFMSASSIQAITFVFNSAGNIGIFLGLLVLNSHRTEAELQQAVEEVRSLQGIIPICATCKKIRDDRGAWNQLESYISRHSKAEFSHGYCPDCVTKLLATL